jgi:GT2 family glycosyltransferase
MLFSVVIAVRNEKSYILRCLEGVFSQDIDKEYEVIVVDGMSTDGTYELLNELKKKYKFSLIKNKKINAAAGRNLGIHQAKGDIIAFIDSDAIPSNDWLTQIETAFKKNNKSIAGVGGPDLIPKDSTDKEKAIGIVMTSSLARGGRFNPSTQHSLLDEERFVEHIPTCNLALKKDVIEKVGFFDEEFAKGQDLELNHRIIKAGYKLFYSPKIKVVHYRKNHIREFARQVFKWAKAKVAIIRKHGFNGLTSHVYIWPVYFILLFIVSFAFFYLLNIIQVFMLLLLIGFIFYGSIIIFESGRLSNNFCDKKLFLYSVFLFPVIHFSYGFGILNAILKKKIW